MSRFKITIDFRAKDLDPDVTEREDGGNVAHFENNSVSAENRHLMQKSMMELFASWGDAHLKKAKS